MPGTKVPHDAALNAGLNAPEDDITLFHPSGRSLKVAPVDEAFWLAQGFHRSTTDLTATASELKAVFPEALDAILRYVEGVTVDGQIDPADGAAQATAQYAMRRLETLWGTLVTGIEAQYPVRQGPPVRMRTPDGRDVDVDPAQVDLYEEQGWTAL